MLTMGVSCVLGAAVYCFVVLSGLMVYGIFLQYANSKNCKMEFRFAVAKLKIPTILAVVGTGYNWERSEVSEI